MSTIVHTYQTYVDTLMQEDVYSCALARLPLHRQKKAQSYHFAKDQALCAGAWLLLDYAMSVEGVDMSSVSILTNSQGKPSVKDAPFFNLSHSGTSVMCVVSQGGEVGCDVQEIEPWNEKLAHACMQQTELEEMRQLAKTNPSAAARVFFRRWSIKESYMKARGLGLSLHPKSFSVDLSKVTEPHVIAQPSCKVIEYFCNDNCCYATCSLDTQAHFNAMQHIPLRELLS